MSLLFLAGGCRLERVTATLSPQSEVPANTHATLTLAGLPFCRRESGVFVLSDRGSLGLLVNVTPPLPAGALKEAGSQDSNRSRYQEDSPLKGSVPPHQYMHTYIHT